MTAQVRDILFYKGKKYFLASEPLEDFLIENKICTLSQNTSNLRGYESVWKIHSNRLHLVALDIYLDNGKAVDMTYFFPDTLTVFAKWYCGCLMLQSGKLLQYVHSGYESIYEKDLLLEFENGILTNEKVIDNTPGYEEWLRSNQTKSKEDHMSDISNSLRKGSNYF
ncbi:MAG: hypothetical protein KI791_17635 [Cyclobacteriaceae bacterium]|nr:hypothetical protein [Cyclobacteriaceae bacterium SS2]